MGDRLIVVITVYPHAVRDKRGLGSVRLEACAAVNRSVVLGNERDFGRCTALCTHCIVHFALTIALILARVSAISAANRFILETLFCVKFLFTLGENERCAAILAN